MPSFSHFQFKLSDDKADEVIKPNRHCILAENKVKFLVGFYLILRLRRSELEILLAFRGINASRWRKI